MAQQDAQDRNLPASQRKISKAREEGQVARSRDLGHFAVVAAGAALAVFGVPVLATRLQHMLEGALRFDRRALAGPQAMVEQLATLGLDLALAVALLGGVMGAVALASGVASGGWNFTWKAMSPKLEKFNPLTGLGRVFSFQQLSETLKACVLALVVGGVGAAYLWLHLPRFAESLALPLPAALPHAGAALAGGIGFLVLALAAFALVDVPLQRKRLLDRLKMSHQEMKQEHKELEGNQEVKGKRRVMMRELSRRRMLAAVPKADLVVMNPTHYAVALRYDEGTMAAPRVVAKGADLLALKIRDTAREHGVPVLEAPPLARALYAHAKVDGEIPAALFAAVAQVLAYVYQLRALVGGARAPQVPQVEVPAGLDPHSAAPG